MRFTLRGVFALLLILVATFSGLACSAGNSSKISKNNVGKLNAANAAFNAKVSALDAKAQKEVSRCAGKANRAACVNGVVARHDVPMRAAALTWAAVYDQVAGDAHGACQEALKAVARAIRTSAAKINGGVFPGTQRLSKNENAMVSACKLRRRNKK